MATTLFGDADTLPIVNALLRDCLPDQIVSIQFVAAVPPVRSLDPSDQWRRFREIVGCELVYNAFGISALPVESPALLNYSHGLETIGTLANLLMSGGIHHRFVDGIDCALATSRNCLDSALSRDYDCVEAYSTRQAWCDWFIGDGILDETVLLGSGTYWWLLCVTGTD